MNIRKIESRFVEDNSSYYKLVLYKSIKYNKKEMTIVDWATTLYQVIAEG